MRLFSELRPDLFPEKRNCEEHFIHIAYCPERVLPGNTMYEFVHNDRIIGGLHNCCSVKAQELYKSFVKGECYLTNARTAEMTKLTENAYRDVNIAFANELSMICDKLNIDVWTLIQLANKHPRVKILKPMPGVGGHCIAIDPWFIVDSSPMESRLIRTAREVNDSKPEWVFQKVLQIIRRIYKNVKASVACLGLSYKTNIDDLREIPAVEIVEKIAKSNLCEVCVVEPFINKLPTVLEKYSHIRLTTLYEAISSADVIVILVDHDEFKNAIKKDGNIFLGKFVIDTLGILSGL